MRRTSKVSLIFALATSLSAAIAPAATDMPPAVGLVFDSSNSMWRQIDGENKVSMLRSALAASFQSYDGKLDMALLTFGQQEEEACDAVKTVVPVETLKAAKFSAAVQQEIPGKGATPLALAIDTAAEAIQASTRPASLVVISDGLDTCRADPCAAAAQAKAKAPALTIHVIAFDSRSRDQLAGLSCMASETGGKYFAAANRAELDAALADVMATAVTAMAPEMAATAKPPAGSEPAAAEKPSSAPVGETKPEAAESAPPTAAEAVARQMARAEPVITGTLRLSAALTADMAPLTSGLVWRIFPAKPDETGAFQVIQRSVGASPVFQLAKGDYIVHVAYGKAGATKEVSLAEGENTQTIVLNAGALRLSAERADGEPIPINLVNYAVYSSEQDQFGERKLILPAAEPGRAIRVNAGTYFIVSQYGDANAVVRAEVKVEAGKLSDAVVVHHAARVTLKLVNEAGGEAMADTSWSVLTPEGDVVTESVGAFPTHILAEGTYTVIANHGGAAYSRQIEIKAGGDGEFEIMTGEKN